MAEYPPVNFRVQRPSRTKLSAGDIFAAELPDGGYIFGRVVRTDARCFGPSCILIYIFRHRSETSVPPPRLLIRDLLLPPRTVNRLGWSRGYFLTVAHRPFEDGERMPVHYFKQTRSRPNPESFVDRFFKWKRSRADGDPDVEFVDEDQQPTGDPPAEALVGWAGLGNYRTIDDEVSIALGIPPAPDSSDMRAR